jgi:hypothetical protein
VVGGISWASHTPFVRSFGNTACIWDLLLP